MQKWLNPFHDHRKNYKQLANDNSRAIAEYNEKILSVLALMGGVLTVLPLLAMPISDTKAGAAPAYLLAVIMYFGLFFLSRLPAMKKYTLYGLYGSFCVYFLLAIYLSVIHSPHMRATILLGGFCLMPLSFIDRPARMNVFAAFWVVVHTALALFLKPLYALDDTINILCFALFGGFLGNIMVWVRLESYEARRLLTIEKETDVLTGLNNRRKLFDTLAAPETSHAEAPTGIMVVDIDHFKDFNDQHGHAAGDRYLTALGEVLLKFAQNFNLQFFRYGGEEFVAIVYGYGEKDLFSIAESLRIAVQSTSMDGHSMTVSIGVAYCGDEKTGNYESVIIRADNAVYAAKRAGRNTVRADTDAAQQETDEAFPVSETN